MRKSSKVDDGMIPSQAISEPAATIENIVPGSAKDARPGQDSLCKAETTPQKDSHDKGNKSVRSSKVSLAQAINQWPSHLVKDLDLIALFSEASLE
jgi:hypothetical protein